MGAVKCKGNTIEIQESFHHILQQEVPFEQSENVGVHGITQRQTTQGIVPKELIPKLLHFLKGSVLMAHHASFDIGMLNHFFKAHYPGLKIMNPVVDTMKQAQRLEQAAYLTRVGSV